ncbi:hypothetical protein A2U01_0092245, partial [Trifolium medium]|nr:hypothetical protein [Trifolium medium]
MRIKSGQTEPVEPEPEPFPFPVPPVPSPRVFKASTNQVKAFPPNPI